MTKYRVTLRHENGAFDVWRGPAENEEEAASLALHGQPGYVVVSVVADPGAGTYQNSSLSCGELPLLN